MRTLAEVIPRCIAIPAQHSIASGEAASPEMCEERSAPCPKCTAFFVPIIVWMVDLQKFEMCLAAAFALSAVCIRVWIAMRIPGIAFHDFLFAWFGPFVAATFVGAGVGELCGNVGKGAKRGVYTGIWLCASGIVISLIVCGFLI